MMSRAGRRMRAAGNCSRVLGIPAMECSFVSRCRAIQAPAEKCTCIFGLHAMEFLRLKMPGHPGTCRKMLLHFRHTGHPWRAGNCSCISGIHAIHGDKKTASLRTPCFCSLLSAATRGRASAARSRMIRTTLPQNLYIAVIMTDQRWLGIGTPGVWPSLITRFCGM